MSQRVSITYSLPIEDVPTEAERLFKSCHTDLVSLGQHAQRHWGDQNKCTDLLEDIEEVREEIQALYLRLGDVTTIMGGYVEWARQNAVATQEEVAEEDEDPTAAAVVELEQQLQSLKDSLVSPPHRANDELAD
jgi:hypothetical protein